MSRPEQRAVLRRFAPEDRDGFVEMNRDPGVRKYFPGLLTPEESLGEMTRIEQHWDTHGFGPWTLAVRGDFAGILGLKWAPPDMPFAPAVELLYRLIPRFWGQGLATEGSLVALEFGFCELHLDTVVAFAVEANTGSRRVMEKIGMVYGSDFDHPSIPELSPLRRHVLYSLNALTGTRSRHQFASWSKQFFTLASSPLGRFLRAESPRISIRRALWTSRSNIPSASVGHRSDRAQSSPVFQTITFNF